MLKNMFELADREKTNITGMLTWALNSKASRAEGFRTLASNGIDKPVLNLFPRQPGCTASAWLLSIAAARYLSQRFRPRACAAQLPTWITIAVLRSLEISVLIWNYHDDVTAADLKPRFTFRSRICLQAKRATLHISDRRNAQQRMDGLEEHGFAATTDAGAIQNARSRGAVAGTEAARDGDNRHADESGFAAARIFSLIQLSNRMRLVQLSGRRVAVVEEPQLRLLDGCTTIYDLATECLLDGIPLLHAIEQRKSGAVLDAEPIYQGRPVGTCSRFSASRARSGTGLTHQASAVPCTPRRPLPTARAYLGGVGGARKTGDHPNGFMQRLHGTVCRTRAANRWCGSGLRRRGAKGRSRQRHIIDTQGTPRGCNPDSPLATNFPTTSSSAKIISTSQHRSCGPARSA